MGPQARRLNSNRAQSSADTHARERGSISVAAALSLIALVGLLVGAFDLGRMTITKAELQNAADSCALAAASELDGAPDALTRAIASGITVGTRNKTDFQSAAVSIAANDITFSTTLSSASGNNSSYQTSASAPVNSRYVLCRVTRTGIPMVLSTLTTLAAQDMSAEAVGTLVTSSAGCAIPLPLCRKPGGVAPNFGYTQSEIISRTAGSWITLSGTPGQGTAQIAERLQSAGVCNLAVGQNIPAVTEISGSRDTLDRAWNTRFGIYHNSINPAAALPDRTGSEYPVKGPSSYAPYLTARAAFEPFVAPPGDKDFSKGGSTSIYSKGQLQANGINRRLVPAPFLDCDAAGVPSGKVLGFGCVLLLRPLRAGDSDIPLEYRGAADAVGSPCVTTGTPGVGVGGRVAALAQ